MKKMIATFMICLTAVLVGCSAGNMASVEQKANGEYEQVLRSNNLLLLSRLKLARLNSGSAGNLMRGQATLENRWKFQLDFQYKFKWFDQDGFEVSAEGRGWTPVVIPGRNQLNVQATAPNPSAKRYEIWVRE